MKKKLGLLASFLMLVGLLVACGDEPAPIEAPPTQTPWIVVITPTSGQGEVAEVEPTAMRTAKAATPTESVRATATPTQKAAAGPTVTKQATTKATPTSASAGAATEPAEDMPEATETAEPTDTPAPVAPTNTPAPGALKYPSPVLLEPQNNQPVSWRSTIVLEWVPIGELADDEFYHLHLERPPKTAEEAWYGDYVYVKDTQYVLDNDFLAPFHLSQEKGEAVVYWWVRVARQTGEEDGKPVGVDVGEHSERRTLILKPKPEG